MAGRHGCGGGGGGGGGGGEYRVASRCMVGSRAACRCFKAGRRRGWRGEAGWARLDGRGWRGGGEAGCHVRLVACHGPAPRGVPLSTPGASARRPAGLFLPAAAGSTLPVAGGGRGYGTDPLVAAAGRNKYLTAGDERRCGAAGRLRGMVRLSGCGRLSTSLSSPSLPPSLPHSVTCCCRLASDYPVVALARRMAS